MSEQKQYCENLYKEYKTLKEKTRIDANTVMYGEKIKPQRVNLEDLLKKEEIRRELIEKCKPLLDLNPDEWFEIENE